MRLNGERIPDWLFIAEQELGVRERAGKLHNKRILDYLKTALNLGNWGRNRDETAWCAAFVNWCLEEAGYEGTDHALARSFLTWGDAVEGQVLGAIIVIRYRGNKDAVTGGFRGYHVGFLIRDSRYSWRILGGNQNDSVSYRNFSKRMYTLKALRWPSASTTHASPPTHTEGYRGCTQT